MSSKAPYVEEGLPSRVVGLRLAAIVGDGCCPPWRTLKVQQRALLVVLLLEARRPTDR